MSAALNPKMRQAFALAHAVPHRKDKKAIAHKLVEVLCEAIRMGRQEYEKGRYGQADRGGGAQGIAE